jgi:uncharacterized Fe-S cluster-containing radical SAM superfamily protein
MKISNWCPEIYRGVFIDRVNDDKIRVAPCCLAATKIESVDTFDFNTSPYLTKLRQQVDRNEQPVECDRCWQVENTGHKSRRMSAIEFYDVAPNSEVLLEGIDHSATWACNLACIMCGPQSSSTWATELDYTKNELINLGRRFQKSNNFLDKLDFSNIKKIHFNGGEPMLNNDQTHLLEHLEQQGVLKNTFISYNTNGTVMPNDKIINLWKKARLVKLFFSIDGTDSAFEYIRYPGKWAEVSNNLLEMKKQLPRNVMFGFNVTVGCYNLFEIVNVYRWFEQHLKYNREGDNSDFNWQFANNFDIKNLNQLAKISAIECLSPILQLEGIVKYIKSTLNYVKNNEWITELDTIDQRRNTNWRKNLQIGKYY